MTAENVEQVLIQNDVPRRYYSFKGAGGGTVWALERLGSQWTISFYDKRGGRDVESVYATEDEASRAFLIRMNVVLQKNQHRSLTCPPGLQP